MLDREKVIQYTELKPADLKPGVVVSDFSSVKELDSLTTLVSQNAFGPLPIRSSLPSETLGCPPLSKYTGSFYIVRVAIEEPEQAFLTRFGFHYNPETVAQLPSFSVEAIIDLPNYRPFGAEPLMFKQGYIIVPFGNSHTGLKTNIGKEDKANLRAFMTEAAKYSYKTYKKIQQNGLKHVLRGGLASPK